MTKKVRKAVFPAAGLGTRFLPATKAMPKEMLPLVDKPLIQYGVEEAKHSGVQNIIIVTGRGKSAIEDHFDVSFELEHLLESRHKKDLLATVRAIEDAVIADRIAESGLEADAWWRGVRQFVDEEADAQPLLAETSAYLTPEARQEMSTELVELVLDGIEARYLRAR